MGRVAAVDDDELKAGLAAIAARMTEEAKGKAPGGGALIREDVADVLRAQFAVVFPYPRDWHKRWLAEEAALSRGYKFGRRIRYAAIDWRRRVTFAVRHLRGIECERDC